MVATFPCRSKWLPLEAVAAARRSSPMAAMKVDEPPPAMVPGSQVVLRHANVKVGRRTVVVARLRRR